MVWLPVVERELRVAARRQSTHRIRVLALLAVTVALAWVVFVASRGKGAPPANDGRNLFLNLSIPIALFCVLIGVFATSDCMGVEKREGTLGLLFLTDLKGYDVVFGKLVASSLNGFYALVAVLPVLGLPLLLGGVTFREFLAMIVALFTAIVFSLSAGIYVSTYQQSDRKAMFMTCAFLVTISFGPTFVDNSSNSLLWVFSPIYPIAMSMNSFGSQPWGYWRPLGVIWFMTFVLLHKASRHAPKSWQEKAIKTATKPIYQYRPLRQNQNLLQVNPFAWLASRGEADPRLVWLFLSSIVGIWLFFALLKPGGLKLQDMFHVTVIYYSDMAINTVLKIWIISEASRRFAEDRGTGAFELLLSTPLTARQMIQGQWLALRRQFAGPLIAVAAWDIFLGLNMRQWQNDERFQHHWLDLFFLFADAIPLVLVGMWLGLLTQSRNRAILTGLLLVLTLPWLLTTALISSNEFLRLENAGIEFWEWGVIDAAVAIFATKKINEHFQLLATEGRTSSVKK